MAEGEALTAYADCEPLLSDQRLAEVEGRIRERYPALPDDVVFVTAIVEPPEGNDTEVHFLVIGQHPKLPEVQIRASSRGYLDTWLLEKQMRDHYVNGSVPMDMFSFDIAARVLLSRLDNLKAMND